MSIGRFVSAVATVLLLIASVAPTSGSSESWNYDRPGYTGGDVERDKLADDLTTLTVTVADRTGNLIPNLAVTHFTVFDNGLRQKIAVFRNHEGPSGIGILFDTSGSMKKARFARDLARGVSLLAMRGLSSNRYFLLTFGDRLELLADWTADQNKFLDVLNNIRPIGPTRLYDALYESIEKLKNSTYYRKVIVVLSDGEDNSSQHKLGEIRQLLAQTGVIVYSVGVADPQFALLEAGREILLELSRLSGGACYLPSKVAEIRDSLISIAVELANQYQISYFPTDSRRDGRWHKVRVEVEPLETNDPTKPNAKPKRLPLSARSRAGYYAPHD